MGWDLDSVCDFVVACSINLHVVAACCAALFAFIARALGVLPA